MNKTSKLAFGIATIVWPFIIPAVAMLIQIVILNFRYTLFFSVTVGWFCFTAIFVYTTFHAMKNSSLSVANKNRWMMYLLFCNVVAVPVYWYRYIWRGNRTKLDT